MDYPDFTQFREPSLSGRYLTLDHIKPLIFRHKHRVEGYSVKKEPVYSLTLGNGPIRILMWSQMHGNESTTTKGVFDLLNYFTSTVDPHLLERLTICLIPMLNPDGSEAYTRENANLVDLNRDFIHQTQPETGIFLDMVNRFKPDYAFNLHDQRTIYGAGDSGQPATLSFLSPSCDETRAITPERSKAMEIIVGINRVLQKLIPGQIGRYDDGFNANCVGDTLQMKGIPTILFEAGHYPGDYQREQTRYLVALSIYAALKHISDNVIVSTGIDEYLHIPQNKVNFNDFVYKNVKINYDGNQIITNLAAQYQEVKEGQIIQFKAHLAQIGTAAFGHFEYDAWGALFQGIPEVGQPADFVLGDQPFVNGVPLKQ